MRENLFLWIEVFIFIIACLVVLKNLYRVLKVALTKEGKVEEKSWDGYEFALSIAWILSMIIVGF